MEELRKIIEGFKRAEGVCHEFSDEASDYHMNLLWKVKASAYREVVLALENFLTRYEDIKKERSNWW